MGSAHHFARSFASRWLPLALLAGLFGLGAPSLAMARTWSSADGKFKIDAELDRVEGGAIFLRNSEGQMFRIPVDKLSEADREFVKKLAAPPSQEKEKPPVTKDPPVSPPPAAAARRPVPSEEAREASTGLLREIFAKEIAGADTNAKRVALAKQLIDQASTAKERPAEHYVLLQAAATLAAQGADPEVSLTAADILGKTYDMSTTELKLSLLTRCAEAARTPKENEALAKASLAAVTASLTAEDFSTADKLAETALGAARHARDTALVKEAVRVRDIARQAAAAFKEVQKAVETLKSSPEDATANLMVGRYRCLIRGDWPSGLPLLARGSDESFRKAAEADLAAPGDANGRAAVGDLWWELAEKQEGEDAVNLKLRAVHWYEQAIDDLKGLAAVKVEKRLEEAPVVEGKPATPKRIRPIDYNKSEPGPSFLGQLEGFRGSVLACAIAPSGKLAASSHGIRAYGARTFSANPVFVWDATGKNSGAKMIGGHGDFVDALAFSPDSKLLATGSRDRMVRLWSLPALKQVAQLGGHAGQVHQVAFSPDGKWLASASSDKSVRLWDVAKQREHMVFTGHDDRVMGVAFAPDGKTLASIGFNGPVFLWDVESGKVKQKVGPSNGGRSVAFSRNGAWLAASGMDRRVRVWDAKTFEQKLEASTGEDNAQKIVLSPDGGMVAWVANFEPVALRELPGGGALASPDPERNLYVLAISDDGRTLATGGSSGATKLWRFRPKE